MRLGLLAVVVPVLCQAQGLPRLAFDSTYHDFGKLAPDTRAVHRFKVTNVGDGLLRSIRLFPTCGCTSALVGRNSLEPGESTEVEVTFNAAGFKGLVRKTVEVVTDAPAAPSTTLSFMADVQGPVSVASEDVYFQELTPKDRRKASVKLESATGQPMDVTDMELSEAPWLGVATRPAGRDVFVDLELLARALPKDKPSGTDTLTVHVSNPRASLVSLKVHWEKLLPVVATPARIAWAQGAGQELTASVLLTARDKKPFRILSARTTSPLIQVKGLAKGAVPAQRIQVVLSAEAHPGEHDEKAILTLDAPGHPELEIRVSASLR